MTISSASTHGDQETAVSPHNTIFSSSNDDYVGKPTAQTPVDKLLERGLLVKVTQPELNKRVARAWTLTQFDNPYIEQHEGRYFISLAPIKDKQEQRQLYHQLHRFQIGATIDVTQLPPQLRHMVQPQLIPRERFVGAFALGLVPGLVVGILIMAIAILLNTLLQIPNPIDNFRIVAYTFAVAFALGWLLSTIIIWYELSKDITNQL